MKRVATNRLNVDLLMAVLSDILSDKYDAEIKITARPKPSDSASELEVAAY